MSLELEFVPALLIILIAAGAGRLLAEKTKQPPILGELVSGAVLGSFIGFSIPGGIIHEPLVSILTIANSELLFKIADIGVILLLFSTGLATNFEELKRLELASSVVAVSGVFVPFILGFFITIFLLPPTTSQLHLVAFFVGVSMVATSVGVSTGLLREFGILKERIGTLIIGTAVVDDVIGVILMTIFVGIAAGGGIVLGKILLIIILAAIFFTLSFTIGIRVFRKVSEKVELRRENLLLLGLIIAICFGIIAEKIKLGSIVGAFVAGLLVGQSHFSRKLRDHVSLFAGAFFIPVFFVTVGMQFELVALGSVGIFTSVLVIAAIAGKIIGCGFGAKAFNFDNKESLTVGLAMIPRAEVALILIKFGLEYGVVGPGIASAILAMAVITCIITSPLLSKVYESIKKSPEQSEKIDGS
ncbi:hypothetical protein AKJ43_01690 [candidate division MSBL1 archaeon SCGC-AAA261D19]|uniref:Cation/H+ exchanger transmembrane domain-containing protein n=1 Tax=candidate division MSBL1 archaeon SCGC-AAA261D19 TaxID=1698273 RepID=A0A133V7V3_9EURY|nr:hypothetical protein AKJ43_01690 [candidate division MSBL1 archaeon SCGC-AAA261D19]